MKNVFNNANAGVLASVGGVAVTSMGYPIHVAGYPGTIGPIPL